MPALVGVVVLSSGATGSPANEWPSEKARTPLACPAGLWSGRRGGQRVPLRGSEVSPPLRPSRRRLGASETGRRSQLLLFLQRAGRPFAVLRGWPAAALAGCPSRGPGPGGQEDRWRRFDLQSF